jgi:hypothetical protein
MNALDCSKPRMPAHLKVAPILFPQLHFLLEPHNLRQYSIDQTALLAGTRMVQRSCSVLEVFARDARYLP